MADKGLNKLPRRRKTAETVREHAEKKNRKKNVKKSKQFSKLKKPINYLKSNLGKDVYIISFPNKKIGHVLNKRYSLVPKFIKNSWGELKLVTWPTRKIALKLTLAVFIFAIVFALFVQLFDLIFNRLFELIFT